MKITIRDLFWLILLAAVTVGWWLDHARQGAKHEEFRAKVKTIFGANGLSYGVSTCAGCDLGGYVLDTNTTGLVEVSLGSDDGLKAGHTLQVYRGKAYLGQITIRKTSPDRAVGQIDKAMQRGRIQKGDNVATKLG